MLQKMKSCLKGKKQKGISLLEVLLSLTIISVILVMATRYYFEASTNARAQATAQLLTGLKAEIAKIEGQTGNAMTLPLLISGYNFLPSDQNGTTGYTAPLDRAAITLTTDTPANLEVTFRTDPDCLKVKNLLDASAVCTKDVLTLEVG